MLNRNVAGRDFGGANKRIDNMTALTWHGWSKKMKQQRDTLYQTVANTQNTRASKKKRSIDRSQQDRFLE
jgi:hypothetical protein